MNRPPLEDHELTMVRGVFGQHPTVSRAILFGSRAKGTHAPHSDVDLVVVGNVTQLEAEEITSELEELPLPYRFEVQPLDRITLSPLREHIDRVGICVYAAAWEARAAADRHCSQDSPSSAG